MLSALHRELDLQKEFLNNTAIRTIYFGGGTPSIIGVEAISELLDHVSSLHNLIADPEITLEANPDDLNPEFLDALRQTTVNRLSIGIQSFFDEDLHWMNRSHNARQAVDCVSLSRAHGFEVLTADLIYGSPTTTDEMWQQNVRQMLEYDLPHLSAYALTVEEKTALHHFIQTGRSQAVDEEKVARQYIYLMEAMALAGYEHYEISNFAKPGKRAVHNISYWKGTPYLGIGPSAHSFDGQSRYWNIANNSLYINSLGQNLIPCESELIEGATKYNEYIMTGLRTIEGVDVYEMAEIHEQYANHFQRLIIPFLERGWVEKRSFRSFRLTREGKLYADGIAGDLFWID